MKSLGYADTEDFGDLVGGHLPKAHFAGALKDFANGKVPLEEEVTTKFNLLQGVEAAQIHGLAFPCGELGAENQGPVFQPTADDLWAQAIGGRLQSLGIGDGEKSVVLLAELDSLAEQLFFNERVTIDVVGGVEGKKDPTRSTMGPRTSSRR